MHRWLLIECFLLRSPPRMFTNSGLKTWTVIQTTGSHFHKQMIGWSAAGTFGSFRRTCRGLKLHQRDTLTPASSVVPLLVGWLTFPAAVTQRCWPKVSTQGSLTTLFQRLNFLDAQPVFLRQSADIRSHEHRLASPDRLAWTSVLHLAWERRKQEVWVSIHRVYDSPLNARGRFTRWKMTHAFMLLAGRTMKLLS